MDKNVSHFAPSPQALMGHRGIPALLALHTRGWAPNKAPPSQQRLWRAPPCGSIRRHGNGFLQQKDLCCSVIHVWECTRVFHDALTLCLERGSTGYQDAGGRLAGRQRRTDVHCRAERPSTQVTVLRPWTRSTVATVAPIAPGRSTPIRCQGIAGPPRSAWALAQVR